MSNEANYTVKALDSTTWPAFAALVEANDGVWGGCWCMSFHEEGIGKQTTAELNRQRKHDRVHAGAAHAALVLDGDDCVGWAQFGQPDEVPKIKILRTYKQQLTSPPDWRIACCFVGKGHRRQGISAVAIAGAIELIAELGGGLVEGYPEGGSASESFMWNGALSTYHDLGFTRDRQIGRHRWVVTKTIDPAR